MLTVTIENEDFLAKALVIGVTVDDLMAEINVFDWMDLRTSPDKVVADVKARLKVETPLPIHLKAYLHKFETAVKQLSSIVEEVHRSYNIPGKDGLSNEVISQYYYLKYWADKKAIAVDYNETDYNRRKLFNLYTILFDIYADKLANFNTYNHNKQK